MLLKIYRTQCKVLSIVRLHHRYSFGMNKAYLRHLEDGEQFQLSLAYVDESLKINRQFNFCRKLTEPVTSFLSRLATNVEKVVNKKNKKRNNQSEENTDPSLSIQPLLFVNKTAVDGSVQCKEIFQVDTDIIIKILDKDYSVIVNSPWVDTLSLPKSILAKFPTYPSKFKTVFTEKDLSEFKWFRSKSKLQWIEVGQSFIYTPSNEDVGSYLKFSCVPKNKHTVGPLTEVISDVTVDAGPGLCPFEVRHSYTTQKLQGKEFRVVTYNILADLYCDSDFTRTELHPYCPPYALAIDYRKQLILKELIGYNADIICLQEVDKKIYDHDLEPVLSHLGYDSNFSIKGGQVAEGLACFFSRERFNLLESYRIVLSELVDTSPKFADIWEKISKNSKLVERFKERNTAVQATVIESRGNNEILVVANTHLYFHPDSDHIRLLQGGLAVRYLEHVVADVKKKFQNHRVSLIFCGDFNSVPECGIYKLYTTGSVPEDCIDYQSNAEEAVKDLKLEQSFKLKSACGTPKYTNFTAGFADCLDYIFYDINNLIVRESIPLPRLEELNENTALPSIVFPSDHISLVANLKWL